MKRITLMLCLVAIALGGTVSARKKNHYNRSKEELTKEERKALEKEKKEQKKREGKAKAADKKYENERKAAAKKREQELKKEEAARKKELKKQEQEEAKALKKHDRELKKLDEQRKKEERAAELKAKEERKAAQKRYDEMERKEKYRRIAMQEEKRVQDRLEQIKFERENRLNLTEHWKDLHALETQRDYEAGRYADLYKNPAWPFASFIYENKDLLSVDVCYKYATDAYGSDRSRRDITALAFGEKDIQVQDILLASKLVAAGKVDLVSSNDRLLDKVSRGSYLTSGYAENNLYLNGKVEEYVASLNFSRYILHRFVNVGLQLPIEYKKHTLKAWIDGDAGASTILHEIYDLTDAPEYLKLLLSKKGINELGGSVAGLGDVVLFANVQTGARSFEKVMAGLKIYFPTGHEASTSKLWAPQLGNGGATKLAVYGSMLIDYSRFLNPHIFIEGAYTCPANVKERIPVKVTLNTALSKAAGSTTVASESFAAVDYDGTDYTLGANTIAFGDRIKYKTASTATADSYFDTTVRGFSDKVSTVRLVKGPEFSFRLGNIFERFIYRRGFLDVYYDFFAKWKNEYRGLNTQDYNIDILRDNTHRMEHKVGLQYTYQFDPSARWQTGAMYTFAGLNAQKAFVVNSSLSYSF